MDVKEKILWNKLNIDLELLTVADPNSIIPLILDIHQLLFENDDINNTLRKINFMSYELQNRCEHLTEQDRHTILSDYLFNEKNFTISALSSKTIDENDWLLPQAIEQKQTNSFVMALIYVHFAQQLQIPIYLIHTKDNNILKWVRQKTPTFLDLSLNATEIGEKKICELLLTKNENEDTPTDLDNFDILPAKAVVNKYLRYLLKIFNAKKMQHHSLTTLDILMKLDPSHLDHLKQRALLLKQLKQYKDALRDIKRYYSLNGEQTAPVELKVAYYELQNLTTVVSNLIH